eukprot:CAMPEP_0198199688 /NCGR_PEP_ID=MMETSP1445-20131203/2897_1 /TAXON_ID=36898 /ORGANISM="Pyramimonas sp., Strain CCMP2087" /LENGTH=435 /DNA_ID=CAMNT_0043869577 /DNA_START=357 /DNA_END=1661 /DNA_ORIENTATION=-
MSQAKKKDLTEKTSLISKLVGDEESGLAVRKADKSSNWTFFWLVVGALIVIAGVVAGAIFLAGGSSLFSGGDDDDDDGGDGDDDSGGLSDETPLLCQFESIREGNPIACHDPTGCDGFEDESEWCFVSDDTQPAMFAKVQEDLHKLIDKNSTLAQIGSRLSNLSSTCVVGACKDRKCVCRDNGDGTSFCPGLKQTTFPFIDVDAGSHPNCETAEPETFEDSDGQELFEGEPTNIKVMDVINLNSSSLSPLAIAIKHELDAGVPLVSTRSSKDDDDAEEVPFHCTLESIAGGNAIACHDPSGCSDSDDETEWCSISFLAKTGGIMANLSSTCVVGACKHRKCQCTPNGDKITSFCKGAKLDEFPFTSVEEGNYPICEVDSSDDDSDSDSDSDDDDGSKANMPDRIDSDHTDSDSDVNVIVQVLQVFPSPPPPLPPP